MERRPARPDSIEARLRVIREAARHQFPTADIEVMLDEIERGRDLPPDGSEDRESR